MTASTYIPFFSDLPTTAIPAAQHLFDDALEPSYNGLKAYADFVSRCNDRKIGAPPRAVVKRWIAGVQAGLIERPGAASEPAKQAISLSYFDNLPNTADAAMQAAWDKADAGQFNLRSIFDSFSRDMNALSIPAPEWREFDAWVKAVKSGQIERPAKQLDVSPAWDAALDPRTKGKAEVATTAASAQAEPAPVPAQLDMPASLEEAIATAAEPVSSASIIPNPVDALIFAGPESATQVYSASYEPFVAALDRKLTSSQLAAPKPNAFGALQTVTNLLVEELIAQMSANIEQAARESAARMLREMADRVQGEAA
jgi:hypothetical protein